MKRHFLPGRKSMTNLESILKIRDITLPTNVHTVKAVSFSSSHVQRWELDCKKGWARNNWCFWIVMLDKTHESTLDCKEIKLFKPKGNQSWTFIGRTDAEAETPIFWPPDAKSWLIGEDPDAGKDWRQKERGWQRMRWLDGITFLHMNLSKVLEIRKDRGAWYAAVHEVSKSRHDSGTEQQEKHYYWLLLLRMCSPIPKELNLRNKRAVLEIRQSQWPNKDQYPSSMCSQYFPALFKWDLLSFNIFSLFKCVCLFLFFLILIPTNLASLMDSTIYLHFISNLDIFPSECLLL